ncbi:hypothetical protein [Streptomyces sp. bgisy060]|uniref:hypothetical protein n=1 Tax=Streptomyces sp. bgisy060 TaxID=3413775 RepID=UPI003EBFDDE5
METVTLTLRTLEGEPFATVQAQPTSTPGLLIHHAADSDGWRLAHQSGLPIAEFTTDQMARHTATYLGSLADWTRSPEELRSVRSLLHEVATVISVANGVLLLNPSTNPTTY